MKNFFSIGELARQQGISRQTLLFYDRIGLFRPAYTDPANGYRYYSIKQLDELDTICIMKRIGLSLGEIGAYLKSYTLDESLLALRRQQAAIERQISELQLVKSRVEQRCAQLEHAAAIRARSDRVTVETLAAQHLLVQAVSAPYSLDQVSIATKECFVRSFREGLPIFYQSGAIVPRERILAGHYTEAAYAFVPIERTEHTAGVITLPAGRCVCTYHRGDYRSIGSSYERLLRHCAAHGLRICSDSYEFAINDYLSTGDESEYLTKLVFYLADEPRE